MDTLLAIATCALAVVTGLMAYFTYTMSKATLTLANESKESSFRQIGIQTWLEFSKRFDSPEMIKARESLATQINTDPSNPKKMVSDTVMNFFEDLGTIYNNGYIDKQLADNTFSHFACRYWGACKPYIDYDREKHNNDTTICEEFEKLAMAMRLPGEEIGQREIEVFLQDESDLKE
jgi:hypothetical protein